MGINPQQCFCSRNNTATAFKYLCPVVSLQFQRSRGIILTWTYTFAVRDQYLITNLASNAA